MVDKVNHYCILSGNYLGAAHQPCIDFLIKVDQHKFIPVFYHNFSKYVYHKVINELINLQNDKIKLSV